MYTEEILEHYRHPQNFGALEKPTHTAEAINTICGDAIKLELRVSKKGMVEDVGFTGSGCAISTASASIFTEWMKGKTLLQLKKLKAEKLLELMGAPILPVRHQCVFLPHKALQRALS